MQLISSDTLHLAVALYATLTTAANSTAVGDYIQQGLGQASTEASTTSSTTSAAVSTTSTANSTSSLHCPQLNNTRITDQHGISYTIYCNMVLPTLDNVTLPAKYMDEDKYAKCADDCDQVNGCTGFHWLPADFEIAAMCVFFGNTGPPKPPIYDDGDTMIAARRVGSGSGHGTISTTSTSSSTRSTSSSTITACAAYETALSDNTLGWYSTGSNITIPGTTAGWECPPSNYPCNIMCAADRPDCISSASSYVASCSPQWSAYSCSYSSYVSEYVTGNYTTTDGDIFVSTIWDYANKSTATESFTFDVYGGSVATVTPVYVYGSPTAVSTVTSTASYYGPETVQSDREFYWASTTAVEETYWTTYTTAYLDMVQIPLTEIYPTPTPACSITEVYSTECAASGCNIFGGTVDVFYWPGVTPGPDGKFANTTAPANPSITEVSGITMTSPSVYVKFETVYAANNCRRVGGEYSGSVLAFDPASISTVTAGPGYLHVAQPDGAAVFNFGDLTEPINAAAYERQVRCVALTGCKTIYPDYKPTISVPLELRSLDPAWSTCYGDLRGFYDPPKALQSAETAAGPSRYTSEPTPGLTVTELQPKETGTSVPAQEAQDPSQTAVPGPSGYESQATPTTSPSDTPSGTDTPDADPGDPPGNDPSSSGADDPAETGEPDSSASEDASVNNDGQDPSTTSNGSHQGSTDSTNAGGIIASLFGGGSSAQGNAQSSPADAVAQPDSTANSDPASSTGQADTGSADPSASGNVVDASQQSADATNGAFDPSVSPDNSDNPQAAAQAQLTQALGLSELTPAPDASGAYLIAGQTLAPGSSAVVASGTTYSLAPSGTAVVVNGVTQVLSAANEASGQTATPKQPSSATASSAETTSGGLATSSGSDTGAPSSSSANSSRRTASSIVVGALALLGLSILQWQR